MKAERKTTGIVGTLFLTSSVTFLLGAVVLLGLIDVVPYVGIVGLLHLDLRHRFVGPAPVLRRTGLGEFLRVARRRGNRARQDPRRCRGRDTTKGGSR